VAWFQYDVYGKRLERIAGVTGDKFHLVSHRLHLRGELGQKSNLLSALHTLQFTNTTDDQHTIKKHQYTHLNSYKYNGKRRFKK
jgi:alpha-D-ribose 1-methylphosphonate 5-triphosphate diphosphatase PhnM